MRESSPHAATSNRSVVSPDPSESHRPVFSKLPVRAPGSPDKGIRRHRSWIPGISTPSPGFRNSSSMCPYVRLPKRLQVFPGRQAGV